MICVRPLPCHLISKLLAAGAHLKLYDPVALEKARPLFERGENVTFCTDEYEAADGADGLILTTEWKQFRFADFEKVFALMKGSAFFDGRNQYKARDMESRGFDYFCIGKATRTTRGGSFMTIQLESLTAVVDEKLAELFGDNTPLFNSSRYALHGGKRLRPMLFLSAALAYDAPLESALQPAIAWELIHTYSLAHDDLPCMDDDDERRGRPTLHRAFPQWQAVLTGDFLLTYAFELLSTAPDLESSLKLKLITLLARSSGSDGMVGGQMLDLSLSPSDTDWHQLEALHRKKTGALFSSALEGGGWLGQAPAEDCARLALIGEAFGIWYQIADDLADGMSETPSALTTLGKERAEELIRALKKTTLAHINALTVPAPLITSILEVIS